MHDDELLKRLGDVARDEEREERARLDPRWDELAAGRLSADEEAALRREAEDSMEGREAVEAFSPLGADFRSRMARRARELLEATAPESTGIAQREPPPWRTAGAEGAPAPAARPERRPAPRRRSRPRPLWWAAAAALAAAVALVVILPRGDGAPLPPYEVRLAGEVRAERSPGPAAAGGRWDEPALFAPGNRFELVLRPEQGVAGRLEVGTYRQEGGSLIPWPLPVEGPHDGTVRIAGTVGREIELPAGGTTLVVVLGRPGALPAAAELPARLGDRGEVQTGDWMVWRRRLAPAPAGEP